MDDRWGAISAIAACITALIALGGIFFVWRQVKQVNISLRSSTNERLMSESLEILRFLAEHPGNYDYFYNSKQPPDTPDEILKCATEMIANYMEHVVLQKDTLPTDAQASWEGFVKDTYARAPIVQKHLKQYETWYDPRLHSLVENVRPLLPSEADASS